MQADPSQTKTAVKQKPAAAPAAPKSVEQKAEKIAKDLQKEYKLTDEQTRSISDAEREFVMQEEQLKSNNVPATAGPYVQLGMMRNDRMRSIMTQEQYSKYETKMKKTAPKN
jgi:hypothetical protein